MRTVLAKTDLDALKAAGEELLGSLRNKCIWYSESCARHGESELLAAFRVRRLCCPSCETSNFSFPYSLITVGSRSRDESHGYFGCTACGTVTRSALAATTRRCHECGKGLQPSSESLLRGRLQRCHSCGLAFPAFDGSNNDWKLCLTQRKCTDAVGRPVVHFDTEMADGGNESALLSIPSPLVQDIETGIERDILRRAGFTRWADLYPTRQLQTLLMAATTTESISDRAVQGHMRIAIAGSADMPGYLCRWDRYYPKAFGASDNHRFAPVGVAVEVNPLASQGRGTLQRRLQNAQTAVTWLASQHEQLGDRLPPISFHVGSSVSQPVETNTTDIVLTDPPYFADVQYHELSSPLVAWAEVLGLITESERPSAIQEAVVNRVRGLDPLSYQTALQQVFKESGRTLTQDGALLLTFNNSNFRAWHCLATALRESQFSVHAIAPVQSELATDHSKQSAHSFTRDLVIECRHYARVGGLVVANRSEHTEAAELIAAGETIAANTWRTYEQAVAVFFERLGRQPKWIRLSQSAEQAAPPQSDIR